MSRSARRPWAIDDGLRIRLDSRLYVSFQRTRRLQPDAAPVTPSSYGVAPVAVLDEGDGQRLIVPVGDDEAVWLGLSACDDQVPSAFRVVVREPTEIDATTGAAPLERLSDSPQNYVVVPPQYGLGGVFIASYRARQFVRVARSSIDAPCQRMQLIVYRPSRPVAVRASAPPPVLHQPRDEAAPHRLEGATGLVVQHVLADPYGLDRWNAAATASATVDLITPEDYVHLAGREAPGPLTDSSKYRGWRLP